MTQPATAETATVTVFGGSSVSVTVANGDTIGDALKAALKLLGIPQETAQTLSLVKNGDDVAQNDAVAPGDNVVAAPNVANG